MNQRKLHLIQIARNTLTSAGIEWVELNNSCHFKIGDINFYPTTGVWNSDIRYAESGSGIDSLLSMFIHNKNINSINQLTVEQIFEIAKSSKDKSLLGICEAIHREIYERN